MNTKRILIVGGGFAGVHAAVGATETLGAAGERDVAVELVSPDPYLVIRPRLYETDLSGVRVPLRDVLGPLGVTHRQATVTDLDVATRTACVDRDPEPIGFEQLVLAAGSRMTAPAEPHVHGADTFAQATALQAAVRALAAAPNPAPRIVVVGAGFTGLELAAELAGTLRRATPGGRVTLIERDAELAPTFGPPARAVIAQAMATLAVEVRTGAEVSDLHRDGVMLSDGTQIDADLVVWSTGPRAPELTAQIPGRRDGLGRLEVDRFLASGVDGIWAAGDCAAARADAEHMALMSCQHASPQGRCAGENAAAALLGTALRPYRQPLYVTCLDLGEAGALLTCGFARDIVLASGDEAKRFKRYINRSLIYPPASADRNHILKMGQPAPAGPAAAAATALALRSHRVRARVAAGAQDRAAVFARREQGPPTAQRGLRSAA